jgi:RNA-directed DNA polymerase
MQGEKMAGTRGRCNCGNHPSDTEKLRRWNLMRFLLVASESCKSADKDARRKSMSEMEKVKLEDILASENMRQAWKAVKQNDGAAGVDHKTIDQTAEHLKQHWPEIRSKLLQSEYQPAAVRAVQIPKADGKTRTLGIPTVQDRLIQQALNHKLSSIFEPTMSPHSYGFRPNRSAHDAVKAAKGYVEQGKTWVVDIDLKSYFDQVKHDRLMNMVSAQIKDKPILKLIGRYLRAPMRHGDGQQEKRLQGTPQGGPLSPLLANIYLDPLDKELERRGIAFVRYADDIALFMSSQRSAQRALQSIKEWLTKHLALQINEDKSGVGPSRQSQLLGFRIHESANISIAPKAIQRLKERVRQLWDARQSVTIKEIRTQWQRYIQGWWNYFRLANWQKPVKQLSGWIRRHMRKYFWQRWHNRAGRYNALKRLGIRGRRLNVAGARRGAWAMAIHVTVNQALKTSKLNQAGLNLPWELAG